TISVFLGVGGGAFGPKTDYDMDYYPSYVATGDLNGDGNPDVITTNNDGGTVSVRLGLGAGALGARSDFAVGSAPKNPVIVDLNAHGKLDVLLMYSYNPSDIAIMQR